MRFLELNLVAFGPFTDVQLDLSQGALGLHIVYGPNEAGKSTALRAIHGALFGIPKHSPDNFLHPYKDLRIGARLQNSAGDELAFVRRKGVKDTLLNSEHLQGGARPDGDLAPFLGGVDATTYGRVFGIDRAELHDGGEELRRLRGLVGESLFAAGLGGAKLAKTLSDLEEETSEIFGKRNSTIRVARRDYDQAVKQRRDATVPISQWQKDQAALLNARKLKQEVVEKLHKLRARQNGLERIRASLKLLAQRKRLLSQLDELGEVTLLPETYSAEERSRCQSEAAGLEQRIESLANKLDGESGIRAQTAQIKIPRGILEQEAVIRDLQIRLGAHVKAIRDRDSNLRVEREECFAQAKQMLRDLRIEVSGDEFDHLRIPPDRQVAIRDLCSDEKHVRGRPGELAAQRREIERAIESNRQQLDQVGAARDLARLRHECREVREQGDLEDERARLDQSLTTLQADADRQLASLGLWNGILTELTRLPIPLRETLERFEQRDADLDERLSRLTDDEKETLEELAETRQEIATLQNTVSVPTEDELGRVRTQRDQTWTQVRGAWLNESTDEDAIRQIMDVGEHQSGQLWDGLADTFERQVAHADALADRLRREADRVAALAQRRARETHLQDRLTNLRAGIDTCRREITEHESAWCEQWSACGIPQPLSPREMRGWLERWRELSQAARHIQQQQDRRDQLESRCQAYRHRVAACLADNDVAVTPNESLNQLLRRAEEFLLREEEADQQRQQLRRDMDKNLKTLDRLTGDEERACEELQGWQAKWRDAMQQLSCPENTSSAQANARLSQLEQLGKQLDRVAELDSRIKLIDRDAVDFQQRVSGLVQRVAPELTDAAATDAAGKLQLQLDEARREQVKLDHLREDAQQTQNELDQAVERHRKLKSRLAELCRVAGVADFEMLPQVEQSSSEFFQRCRQRETIEQQLLDLGGGLSIDELASDAEGQSEDDLAAQLADLREEIETQEEERDRVVAELRELENRCEAADSSTKAAEADERALGILARMHTDAERYLRLRLAATVLRHQIEKHRAENHDPLLARASDLFSRITCNEFAGLQTEYDESDQAMIVGVRRKAKELVPVDSMSGGTRDQLYLSLRLGYLEHQLAGPEPMPLVVDDILVEFDDQRALAALQVLAELSQQTQVVFFTHHRHLLDLAQTHLSEGLFVHQLDARGMNTGGPPTVASATRRPR